MLFTREEWLHSDFSKHAVIRVEFDLHDIRKAFGVAEKKLNHTGVGDPGGQARSRGVMINRIVQGELADQAVTEILNSYYRDMSLQYSAVEYDDIREDAFLNPAPYSILIQNSSGAAKRAEVRSSFCYKLRDATSILNKFSMYGWYVSYGKPTEDVKDLYFQVFYHMRPESVPAENARAELPVFEECLRLGRVIAYVVGGANNDLLLRDGITKKDDVEGAFYHAIYPADTGYDIDTMCALSAS